eukprot:4324934-Amphidinium_carterae.1
MSLGPIPVDPANKPEMCRRRSANLHCQTLWLSLAPPCCCRNEVRLWACTARCWQLRWQIMDCWTSL